jgi:hypothetical protein
MSNYENRTYTVVSYNGDTLVHFANKEDRNKWLDRYCTHSGVNWLIFDVSSFPFPVSNRIVYLGEEW